MEVFTRIADLKATINQHKVNGKTIGFVPTMGALHEGHLSLIRTAKEHCDIAVVSIFVNPIQFNNPEDLRTYPRTLEADCEKLETVGCDMVFAPSAEEMYPEPATETYNFGELEAVMEGPQRPGHFAGVATVVHRLFNIVEPKKAFFGEKDFQQLAIIQSLVKQLSLPVEIVPCPIVRADDGLALSSRNMRLSAEARKIAPQIYATLKNSVERSHTANVDEVKKYVIDTLVSLKVFEPEYFEIVNDTTLQPIANWSEARGVVGCIAVWLDGVRLIDVIRFR
ncbi:MAG: pantoate--beta-alanine ligase [Bacteroidales bacterium]|nr:pantoate--beta-alanine ligase [Bacteroidales bacterium]